MEANDMMQEWMEKAESVKAVMAKAYKDAQKAVIGMMESAGVCAVRLTNDYDSVFMGTGNEYQCRVHGVFSHNGNIYLFGDGNGEQRFNDLFGESDVVKADRSGEADDFVEDWGNDLYNLADDTDCPHETVIELLDTVPEVIRNNSKG